MKHAKNALAMLVCLLTGEQDIPGVVIDRSPDPARVYIGCPGIAVLPGGDYVASHSWFGPGTTNDRMAVFRSGDRGKTWQHQANVQGQWWSSLFAHRGALYLMGVSREYGHAVIRRSNDGGRTWTVPKDARTGLLHGDARYHCAPVPVVVHGGRIWRAMEDAEGGGGWGKHFRAFVMSSPAGADLLDAANWTSSNRLASRPEWLGDGWLEGNVVVTPQRKLVNVLRVALRGGEKAAIVRISDDGKTIAFDPQKDFIDFPGGSNKFTIRFDPRTGRYWALVNKERDPPAYRNVLALTSSADLRNWKVETVILRHADSGNHAWQYIDWLFEGDDIIAVSRTAWDGAHRAHDANYFTFHRIEDFRRLSIDDAPPYWGLGKEVVDETPDFTVKGRGFRIRTLDNDAIAFGNRTYVWQRVPDRFRGWRYTQTSGGVVADIRVAAKRDGLLYVATATVQKGADMTGWEKTGEWKFNYTDKNASILEVFRRRIKVGEEIVVPQGNWSGTIVLIRPAAK